MSAPAQLLPGGLVVLHPGAVLDVARALDAAERSARRDGIRPPAAFAELRRLVDQAAAAVRAGTSTERPDVPQLPAPPVVGASSPQLIGTQEAATMLKVTDRAVRARCRRGSFTSAERRSGRWLVDRAEVAVLLPSFGGTGSVAGHLGPVDER